MRTLRLLPAVLLLAACDADPAPAPPWRGEGKYVEVEVHDLHCAGCEKNVEDHIGVVEGVAAVTSSHEEDLVLVTLEDAEGREAIIPSLREAIHEAGFKVVGEDEIGPAE